MPTVWIVNPFDSLPLEGCRPQRYWLMARAFAAAGCEVRLWSSDFNHATKRRRETSGAHGDAAADRFAVELLPTRPYPTNVCWARIRSHRALAKTFARRAREILSGGERPDLVVASTPPLGLCAAARAFACGCRAAFVCDIQDAWPETFLRLFPRGIGWAGFALLWPLRRLARRLYREADLVTGVCRRYAALSGRSDYHLAYLGRETVGGGESTVRGRQRLVYVGNLGVGYDLETVLRAVSARDGLTLDIAGTGPKEERLRALAVRLGLGSRVRFHGFLGEAALQALMGCGDVGVIPMRDDSWVGLPNKLGDYLAAGLKVVSSLTGECGDLLAATGFGTTYDWGSPASLLAAIDALPDVSVSLPEALRAEAIYSNYARRALACRAAGR